MEGDGGSDRQIQAVSWPKNGLEEGGSSPRKVELPMVITTMVRVEVGLKMLVMGRGSQSV